MENGLTSKEAFHHRACSLQGRIKAMGLTLAITCLLVHFCVFTRQPPEGDLQKSHHLGGLQTG